MTLKIGSKTFAGSARVFDGTLALALRSALQEIAVDRLAGYVQFTNASGAVLGETLEPTVLTPSVVSGTNAAQKAEFEAALLAIKDMIKEMIMILNDVKTIVPIFPALTDNLTGTAADFDFELVDVTYTGVSTSMASAVRSQVIIGNLESRIAQLGYFVNLVCDAIGAAYVTDNLGKTVSFSTVFAYVSVDTGATASGADTGANSIVLVSEAQAAITRLRDNMGSLINRIPQLSWSSRTLRVVASK